MPPFELAAIRVHPVKACRAIEPARWPLDAIGLRHDRSFMLVDGAGRFLSQREQPRLALVRTALDATALTLDVPGRAPLTLPLAGQGRRVEVEVWRHRGPALDCGDAAAALLSDFLGLACRLVRLAPDHARRVSPVHFPGEAHTAFTDGYPLLLLSEASLLDLNRRLPTPLPVDRFRPNLVVRGCAPYAEDAWRRIRVGSVEIAVVKPCERCIVTTTDQATGVREGNEPLRTLATYRRSEGGVRFGQNAVPLGVGTLEVGAPVEVLEAA